MYFFTKMAQINAAVAIILYEHKDKVYISLRQKLKTYIYYFEFTVGKL
ncbi:(deoxy)nucleoside triphosphate pyrophosphohydrolase, partial [Francisella tularensis subsp. holarctica]|nr:(deoxy)nucleoside triphosphate pyrophosphohydrolase [Francisella tularensis subsp. holarctica]